MKSNIFYKKSVYKDLKKIDRQNREKIMHQAEQELSKNPTCGKRLKGEFEGLFSYRVGDYRVIYTLIPAGVLILRISHRKESYR